MRSIYFKITAITLMILIFAGCSWMKTKKNRLPIDEVYVDLLGIEVRQDDNDWEKIKRILNNFGCENCDDKVPDTCWLVGTGEVCDYRGLVLDWYARTASELEHLQYLLDSLRNKGVELGVARASAYITYNGVAAQGAIATNVIIEISPGAELYIDIDQSGRLRRVKTENDRFEGEVRLQRGKEWVYYKTVKPGSQDEAEQFFRLNVFTRIEERLTEERFNALMEDL